MHGDTRLIFNYYCYTIHNNYAQTIVTATQRVCVNADCCRTGLININEYRSCRHLMNIDECFMNMYRYTCVSTLTRGDIFMLS